MTGTINIQDSGYIKPTNEGTQASAGNRANSGTAISIKVAEFIPSLKRNISTQPELNSGDPAEVNLGSIENMQFQLRCAFNTKDDTCMATIQHLLNMVRTRGYKYMWYNWSTTGASDEGKTQQLLYQAALNSSFGHVFTSGEKSAMSVSVPGANEFYHLHVLFTSIQPKQSARSGIVYYTLGGIVLPVQTSTI